MALVGLARRRPGNVLGDAWNTQDTKEELGDAWNAQGTKEALGDIGLCGELGGVSGDDDIVGLHNGLAEGGCDARVGAEETIVQ
ncbi:unnamed protein product [Ilex paraguariensis]|uniref:Uncharacterized protein n=1 Tax=Ilex paraguariensis TaxID=185542 RepID=A0ABC8QYV3_9AQUA